MSGLSRPGTLRVNKPMVPIPIWRACSACHLVFSVGVPEGTAPRPIAHCPTCGSELLEMLEKKAT